MNRPRIALSFLLTALPALAGAQTDPARDALRRRIDFAGSRIVLAPPIDTSGAQPFDDGRFLAALHAVAGTSTFQLVTTPPPPPTGAPPPDGIELEDSSRRAFDFAVRPGDAECGVLRGRTARHDVEVRRHDVDFLVRDRGSYRRGLADTLPDSVFLGRARQLLAGLGAAPAEFASFDVKTLSAAGRPEATGARRSPPSPSARRSTSSACWETSRSPNRSWWRASSSTARCARSAGAGRRSTTAAASSPRRSARPSSSSARSTPCSPPRCHRFDDAHLPHLLPARSRRRPLRPGPGRPPRPRHRRAARPRRRQPAGAV